MLDPTTIIKTTGLMGISFIIFAESGLFFGFFLPGDTLLFSAGIFAQAGYFPLSLLIFLSFIFATLGDNVGYWSGIKVGPALLKREDSIFFSRKHIEKARLFYQKYGSITIVLARFIPIIRTFAPIVAGISRMKYKTFMIYNVVGAFLWCSMVTMLGYYFGSVIPNPDKFIIPLVFGAIAISFIPFIVRIIRYSVSKSH